MKRLLAIVLISLFLTGCTAYNLTKKGVGDAYGGVKTVFSDTVGFLGKVLSGGSLKISIETDAAYNNKEEEK